MQGLKFRQNVYPSIQAQVTVLQAYLTDSFADAVPLTRIFIAKV